MIRIVKITGSILILVFSYSCKKELTHYYVSDAFKQWTVFYNGSFWIFQNDSTLVIDSMFVKGNPNFIEVPPYSSKDNFTLEYIEMSYSSEFLFSSNIYLNQSGLETFYFHIYNNSIYALIANSSDNFMTYYENEKGKITYQLLSQDSVFYIGPEKFSNVVNTQFTEAEKKWKCWFAKDIGLIKVTGENTNPDFSWSLLRYYIAK